jgi:hypothetical protein
LLLVRADPKVSKSLAAESSIGYNPEIVECNSHRGDVSAYYIN